MVFLSKILLRRYSWYPGPIRISKDHPQAPIKHYGTTKLTVEKMLRDFDAAYGVKSASLRYFDAAGTDTDADIGKAHGPKTHLIPLVLDAATGRRPHITVYDSGCDTPDGTCIRDYIHVIDLAQAHILALEHLGRGAGLTAFNIGCDTGYSVKEIIEAAGNLTGRRFPQKDGERRSGEPPKACGLLRKGRKILGWAQVRPGIEIIIHNAWRWHLKRLSK